MNLENLTIAGLRASYAAGDLAVEAVIAAFLDRIDSCGNDAIFIDPPDRAGVMAQARTVASEPLENLPLYGVPFVIKDNIDWAGHPTTAGCPAYARTPDESAPVVERLLEAGAICLGKTNLDQFATGLVGVRSPYGHPRNPFHSDYLPGGSSCGSAVALAEDLALFSLGTDTAGSGRVPAAFNNLVGLKPTRGMLSTRGVVPACRSLDCVSIFALTAGDAATVLDVAAGFDERDPFSRRPKRRTGVPPDRMQIGVPPVDSLDFAGSDDARQCFLDAVTLLRQIAGEIREIDPAPFLEAARLLYEGPWVAERFAAVGEFIEAHPDDTYPVTRQIISGGISASAVDAFRAQYRLAELRRVSDAAWKDVDAIVMPTAPRNFTLDEVAADPVGVNSTLGTYTNFMNLLDLAAVAVPAGTVAPGVPWGVTLFAPPWSDHNLLECAHRYEEALAIPPAKHTSVPTRTIPAETNSGLIPVVVCGAHLEGLALNRQLTDRGGRLREKNTTAPVYRMFALPAGNGLPERPALIRDEADGAAIEVEVWDLCPSAFGDFVAAIPGPLGIGKVLLDDGQELPGFIAEPRAADHAREITSHGGWRAYLAATRER